jgi:hypothetical protein
MANRARRIIKHALAAPGANADIFTAIAPNHQGAVFDCEISLANASIVDVRVTDGSTAYSQAILDGASLTAGTRYSFSFLAPKQTDAATPLSLTYSLRVRTDGIIQSLIVDEVTDR